MKIQNLSFKVGSSKKNSRSKGDRSVAIYDQAERKHVHAARHAHRARLQQIVESEAWVN